MPDRRVRATTVCSLSVVERIHEARKATVLWLKGRLARVKTEKRVHSTRSAFKELGVLQLEGMGYSSWKSIVLVPLESLCLTIDGAVTVVW